MATIGIDITQVTAVGATPAFKLGTKGVLETDDGTKEFIYGQAGEAMAAVGALSVFFNNWDAFLVDLASSLVGMGMPCGANMAILANNEYGWFQVYGKGAVQTLASMGSGKPAYSTATPGSIDDAGTSGVEHIIGVTVQVATGGAPALNEAAVFTYPSIGLTILV